MKSLGIALVTVAALACSCSTSSATAPSSTSTTNPKAMVATLACGGTFAPGTSQPDAELAGKSVAAAESMVAASRQTLRVEGQDGTCNAVTLDLRTGRVDLWIVSGRVVKAILEGPPGTPLTSSTPGATTMTAVVPAVIGRSAPEAAAALRASGLNIGVISGAPANHCPLGIVTAQSPASGTQVADRSTVDLTVCMAESGSGISPTTTAPAAPSSSQSAG